LFFVVVVDERYKNKKEKDGNKGMSLSMAKTQKGGFDCGGRFFSSLTRPAILGQSVGIRRGVRDKRTRSVHAPSKRHWQRNNG
jgi:hypothetical protein